MLTRHGRLRALVLFVAVFALASTAAAQDPYLVRDIKVKPESHSSPAYLTEALGKLFFRAFTHEEGYELWTTDPASGATWLLKDINPGRADASPTILGEVGGRLLFAANSPEYGYELWWTDGTTTQLLKDINPGPEHSSPSILALVDGTLYFRATTADEGLELHATDGVSEWLVKDIDPTFSIYGVPNNTYAYYLSSAGGYDYFQVYVYATSSGYRLWRTTGTGGEFVPAVNAGEEFTSPNGVIGTFDGALYLNGSGTVGGEETGYELWKVSAAGYELVADIYPGQYTYESGGTTYSYPNSSYPRLVAQVGSSIYLRASGVDTAGDPTGSELYRLTSAGVELIEIYPGTTTYTYTSNGNTYTYVNQSNPSYLGTIGDVLLIRAEGPDASGNPTGAEVWKVTGTTATLLQDLNPGTYTNSYSDRVYAYSSSPATFAEKNGKLYLSATSPNEGRELFETDGNSITLFQDLNPGSGSSSPSIQGEVNGRTVFRATDADGNEPWAIDWTTGTATKLVDANPGSGSSTSYYAYYLPAVANGYLFFSAWDPVHGREPWSTDGTPGGTTRLELISGSRPEPSDYYHRILFPTTVGDRLFFSFDDFEVGRELWWSDGTPAGTGLLKDIEVTGLSHSTPTVFGTVNDHVLFVADDGHHEGAHGRELWETNGTLGGTNLLKDVNPGWPDSGIYGSTSYQAFLPGLVVFVADDGTHGREPWVTDGTAGGTELLADVYPGGGTSNPYLLATEGDTAYYRIRDADHGYELLRTKGTPGTTEVIDIWPGTTVYHRLSDGDTYTDQNDGYPYPLAEANGTVYLTAEGADANGDPTGREIWKVTPTGVELVADLYPGTYTNSYYDRVYPNSSSPTYLGTLNGKIILRAYSADGYKLWSLDPADDSATELAVLDSYPYPVGTAAGRIFFRASGTWNGELTGTELWASDGTPGSYYLVKDLYPGTYTYTYGDNTYVYGNSSYPQAFAVIDDHLYFTASTPTTGQELFVTNGTETGTALVVDIYPGGSSSPYYQATYDGMVYFRANDGFHGYETWKTDGTAANTELLKDVSPGLDYGYASSFFEAHGLLYFNARDTLHGRELWRTDGTRLGTALVKDIYPGSWSAGIGFLAEADSRLYFSADDGEHGRELWALDPTPVFAVDFFRDGSDVSWVALKPMEFTVRADDFDGDDLTLEAYLNGQLVPTTGTGATFDATTGSNPISSTFRWTPEVADAGEYDLKFVVGDGSGGHVVEYRLHFTIAGDSDSDGLPDLWETEGYTKEGVFVDLPNLTGIYGTDGADPNRPDIFVEIDWMEDATHDHKPFNQALKWIVDAFAAHGIALHIVVDDPVPYFEQLGTNPAYGYDWSEFDNIKDAYFDVHHQPAFRYCLFAHKLGSSSTSGISRNASDVGELGASDLIVSLGAWTDGTGTQEEQAGTFMHELGHNLGLFHGGADDVKTKPNYLSVMNYLFQMGLLIDNLPAGQEYRQFDYSSFALPPLDEADLLESAGLRAWSIGKGNKIQYVDVPQYAGYRTKWYWNRSKKEQPAGQSVNGPIDWNQDGDTDDTVSHNVNNAAGVLLEGHDDWSALRYTGGLVGGAGIPLPEVTVADELEVEEAREIFPEPPPNPNPPVADAVIQSTTFLTGSDGLAEVVFDGRGSYDPDGDTLSYWWYEGEALLGTGSVFAGQFRPGPHVVSLVVEDRSLRSAPADVSFEVFSSLAIVVTVTPATLWPANHQMIDVTVSVSPAAYACQITDVTSNQEIDAPGSGNTDPDWTFTSDPAVVSLRAERSGKDGDRIYQVHYVCSDGSGVDFTGTVEVTVPHDQGNQKNGGSSGEDGSAPEESGGTDESGSTGDSAGATDETAGAGTDGSSTTSGSSTSTGETAVGGGSATGSGESAVGGESSSTGEQAVGGEATGDSGSEAGSSSGEDSSAGTDSGSSSGEVPAPSGSDTPSLDGSIDEQAGATNGGTEPAGNTKPDGPEGGIDGDLGGGGN